ncbi:hypothetical protein ACFSTC_33470 [Nonomuraea ferruginea]
MLAWGLVWNFAPADPVVWESQPSWFMPASRLLDVIQLATGLYGGLALLALGRGARWIPKARLVTRSLGLAVWLMLPLTSLLGLVLSQGSYVSASMGLSLPVVLANLMTYACAGLQLYCATRCVRLTRRA